MAQAILDAIESGLAIVQDLASTFLTAFSTLFWDAAANEGAGALTTLGNFALIFLGISVVFTVLTMGYALIRGNTGV